MNLQLVSYHFIYRYQLTESQFFKELGQSQEINKANRKTDTGSADISESGASRPSRKKAVALIACLGCILLVIGTCLIVLGLNAGGAAPESQPNINTEDPYLIDYDLEPMLNIMGFKPLAHLGFDVTIEEVLFHYYDTVKYGDDIVTAERGNDSIGFSVTVDASGNILFYNCYINGSFVPSEKLEKFLYDLIVQMP